MCDAISRQINKDLPKQGPPVVIDVSANKLSPATDGFGFSSVIVQMRTRVFVPMVKRMVAEIIAQHFYNAKKSLRVFVNSSDLPYYAAGSRFYRIVCSFFVDKQTGCSLQFSWQRVRKPSARLRDFMPKTA